MTDLNNIDKSKIIQFLRKHKQDMILAFGVEEIGLYGSYAQDRHKINSDIDILVEFKKDKETFDNYMDLKFFLEDQLNKKVDLAIKRSVKEAVKSKIYSETIYA